MKKVIFCMMLAICGATYIFGEPKLESYLLNDLELKRLALEFQKTQLASKKTKIDNGVDIKLSSGTARFRFSDDGNSMSVSPSVSISAPQASNLSLKVGSTIKLTDGENNSSDTTVSLGVDIISAATLNRKISLKKAARTELEAKRAFQNRALEAEKEYYNQLKLLFQSASDIVSKQKDLYDHTISFDEVKAKGYSTGSSKYRQAEMRVFSDRHEIETAIHSLEHDCAVFASKCGTIFEPGTKPEDFLPSEILQTDAIDILSFKKEDYKKIESANYSHNLSDLQRKADKNFTLSATTGYTLKNSNTSFSSNTKTTSAGNTTASNNDKSDTLDIGLNATWKGIDLGAGVNLPISSGENPVYSITATVRPNTFATQKITRKTNIVSEEQELIAIQSAEEDYETAIVDKQTELESILWAKKTNRETFDMWNKLEKDEKLWFEEGIVKESEYLNAFANKQLYRIKTMINDIELLIYNNSIKLLFCRDNEMGIAEK